MVRLSFFSAQLRRRSNSFINSMVVNFAREVDMMFKIEQ